MSDRSSTIFLGDLARAIRELGVSDAAHINLIAEMLGFYIEGADAKLPRLAPGSAAGATGGHGITSSASSLLAEDEAEDAPVAIPAFEPRTIPVEMTFAPSAQEGWIAGVEPLTLAPVKPFPPQEEQVDVSPPPLEPLFAAQWTRGILSAALATNDEEGSLDVERITEMLANYEHVERIPTITLRTLRRGAHLLLDTGPGLMPFMRDEVWLTKEIRQIVGASNVQVFRFVGSPLRGAGVGAQPWPEYSLPLPGTPVVLLTDLGIGRPALAADWADELEWAEFSAAARRAGCPLIALVPYKPARWPRALGQQMTIIQWDRSTTVATISKMLKLSTEVLRP
ncbi:MAG: hypothetical protein ACJ74W_04175 [Pyrinomonadaceae bacterium]